MQKFTLPDPPRQLFRACTRVFGLFFFLLIRERDGERVIPVWLMNTSAREHGDSLHFVFRLRVRGMSTVIRRRVSGIYEFILYNCPLSRAFGFFYRHAYRRADVTFYYLLYIYIKEYFLLNFFAFSHLCARARVNRRPMYF